MAHLLGIHGSRFHEAPQVDHRVQIHFDEFYPGKIFPAVNHLCLELEDDIGMVELEQKFPSVPLPDRQVIAEFNESALQRNVVQQDLTVPRIRFHDAFFNALDATETPCFWHEPSPRKTVMEKPYRFGGGIVARDNKFHQT
jgi:hypothetical protein